MAEKRKRRILLDGIDWLDNGPDVCYTWNDIATRNYSGNAVVTLADDTIRDNAFQYSDIESFEAPNFATTSTYQMTRAFENCTELISFDMPLFAGTFGQYTFHNCNKLTSVHLPKVKGFNGYAFQGCSSLQVIALPALQGNPGTYLFQNCRSLQAADLGNPSRFDTACFKDTALEVLVLRGDSVAGLQNVAVFDNSPFASGRSGGTLYVHSDLISGYQAAGVWSTILGYANNSIEAIEGSIYEDQYADGTPVE